MPLKASGAGELRETDRWDGGAGWMAHPEEELRRASHALVADGEVWLVDPIDAPGLDEWLADLGEVAGAVVLVERHTRDAGTLARRYGVSVHVPRFLDRVEDDVGAPLVRHDDRLAGTGYRFHRVTDTFGWQEAALHRPADGTLVVPESLGTAPYYLTGEERVGVHPMRRLLPPEALGDFPAERLLVGHGEGLLSDAGPAIEDALSGSRRRAPALYAKALRRLVGG